MSKLTCILIYNYFLFVYYTKKMYNIIKLEVIIMKILIDSNELEKLLIQNKNFIGKSIYDGFDGIFASITFTLPNTIANYSPIFSISGDTIKTLLTIFGISYLLWSVYIFISSRIKNYDENKLYEDIYNMNLIQHPFSIIVIKDTFNKYPNRFLLYYDNRWDCNFFINYKTIDDNINNIKIKLSNELKVDKKYIEVNFKRVEIYRKYSVSDKIDKYYEHKFYYVKINKYKNILRQNNFQIDGKKYCWMTISEMENDKKILEKNMDIVNIVKSYM